MSVLKRLVCRHIYENTRKGGWFLGFDNQTYFFDVYKCKRCGKEIKLDFHGKEINPY